MKILILIGLLFSVGCNKKKAEPAKSPLEIAQEKLKKAPSYENYINYGLALGNVGKSQEALTAYNEAVKINPNAPLAWNNLCAEQNRMGLFAEAIKNCEKAIQLEPNFVLAKNNLAQATEGMNEKRIQLSQKKAELFKNSQTESQAFVDLGMEFYNIGEHLAAIDTWGRISSRDLLYAVAQNNVASSYIKLRQFKKAERALKVALDLDPENQHFLNNKVWLKEERSKKN